MAMRTQDIEHYEAISREINNDPAFYKAMSEMIGEARRDDKGFVPARTQAPAHAAASQPKGLSAGNILTPSI
jgi:hypothetical protein